MTDPIDLVAQAKTLDEVVEATALYLARWSPESLAFIPRKCRPHWIGSAEDIEMYAGQLQSECARRAAVGAHISDELELMRNFFSGAACIVSLIRLRQNDAEATLPRVISPVRWGFSSGLSKR